MNSETNDLKEERKKKQIKTFTFWMRQILDYTAVAVIIYMVLPFFYNVYDFVVTGTDEINQYFQGLFGGEDPESKTLDDFINLIKENEDIDELPIDEQTLKEKYKNYFRTIEGKALDTKGISPEDLIQTAHQFVGIPYGLGREDRNLTDCSGLMRMIFAEYGIKLPRTAQEQSRLGRMIINPQDLRRGDFVFFTDVYGGSERFITHVGLYVGSGRFLNATQTYGVIYSSLDNLYWKKKFIFGTRVFNDGGGD
jgi:cell wall-associated NlpC family hydrolase